jgi:hypothetical protein
MANKSSWAVKQFRHVHFNTWSEGPCMSYLYLAQSQHDEAIRVVGYCFGLHSCDFPGLPKTAATFVALAFAGYFRGGKGNMEHHDRFILSMHFSSARVRPNRR